MIRPELKKKRDVRLNVLIEKFKKKIKKLEKMINKAEKEESDNGHEPL